jgi:hypothetical protein
LRGVLERDHDMAMAGFLFLMWEEAATAGQFEYGGVKYDRMQLLTVNRRLSPPLLGEDHA